MKHAMILAACAVLAVFMAGGAFAANFTARGNEPFWNVEITNTDIILRTMEGKTVTISPKPAPALTDSGETYRAQADGQPFSVTIADIVCVDTMSGMTYPKTVTVKHGERDFSGCGGDPASLLYGEWAIEQIDGKPIVPNSKPELVFGIDSRVSGNASCNRYFGSYELTGEGLAFSQLGATRMACEQALMDQEHIFLQILGAVSRFDIDGEGNLVLHSDNGRVLLAVRK